MKLLKTTGNPDQNWDGRSSARPSRAGNALSSQPILREIALAVPVSPESISYASKREAVSVRMNSIASQAEPINRGACAAAQPAVANPGTDRHSIAGSLNEEKALTILLNDALFSYMEDNLHAVRFPGSYLNSSRHETGSKFQFIFEIAGRARKAPVSLEVLSFSYDLAKNLSIGVSAAAVMGESPSNLTDTMGLRYHKIIHGLASKLLPVAVSGAAGEFAHGELHSARNKFGLSGEVEIEVACLLAGKPFRSFVDAHSRLGSKKLSLEIRPAENTATLKTWGKTQQFEFTHLGEALDQATERLRSLQAARESA